MTMRRSLTLLLFAAAALAPAPVLAAPLVVVEARGLTTLKPGQTLDSTKPLVLKQGQHVTLISETGSTLRFDGPYNRPPTASGNSGVDLNRTMGALISQREARAGEFGVTRNGTTLAALPDPWLIDASHGGPACLRENATPQFWRPDAKASATLAVVPADRSWRAVARWSAGQQRISITTDVPMKSNEVYVVNFNGSEHAIATVLVPAALTNDAMRTAWMADRGCEQQASALVKTLK